MSSRKTKCFGGGFFSREGGMPMRGDRIAEVGVEGITSL